MLKKFLSLAILIVLSACNPTIERSYNDYHPQVGDDLRTSKMDSIITKSSEPIVIFSNKKQNATSDSASGMAGSYLWKAALESIAFMPLISSDSNGGAIITDWYCDPATPNEQYKFNIFILNSEIQIGSVKVTAFKQIKSGNHWQTVAVSKDLARNVEDNILKKAIALRAKAEDAKESKKK